MFAHLQRAWEGHVPRVLRKSRGRFDNEHLEPLLVQTDDHRRRRTLAGRFGIALPADFTGVTTRCGLDFAVRGDPVACVCGRVT